MPAPKKPVARVISASEALRAEQSRKLRVAEHAAKLAEAEAEGKASVRAQLLARVVSSAETTIADVLESAGPGKLQLKDITTLPTSVARAIKKVKITTTTDIDGKETQKVEVEMAHHLSYDDMIAKYLGLYPKEPDKGAGDTHNHLHLHGLTPEQVRDLSPKQLQDLKKRLEARINTTEPS